MMIDEKRLNTRQFQVVKDLKKHFKRSIVSRRELIDGHHAINPAVSSSPHFISHNRAPKRGMQRDEYNLDVFVHDPSRDKAPKEEKKKAAAATTKKSSTSEQRGSLQRMKLPVDPPGPVSRRASPEPPTKKDTIEDVQSRLAKDLSPVLQRYQPKGSRYRISLHSNVSNDATAENWSPEFDEIQIHFEPDTTSAASSINAKPTTSATANGGEWIPEGKNPLPSDALGDLVRALDRAESKPGYGFVALKWFRDAFLVSEGLEWAASDSTRNSVLRDAIEKRLILTSKVANPKSPEFPVTAIRLNRLLPETRAVLGTSGTADSEFQPVKIRGESISTTILRDRR
jgi:hypothetical protein